MTRVKMQAGYAPSGLFNDPRDWMEFLYHRLDSFIETDGLKEPDDRFTWMITPNSSHDPGRMTVHHAAWIFSLSTD